MSDLNRRLDNLERIYPKPRAGLTPTQAAELREACRQAAAERGLDAGDVWNEAVRLIEEGWTPT